MNAKYGEGRTARPATSLDSVAFFRPSLGFAHSPIQNHTSELLIGLAGHSAQRPDRPLQTGRPGLITTRRRGRVMTVTTPTKKLHGLPAWFARQHRESKKAPGVPGLSSRFR